MSLKYVAAQRKILALAADNEYDTSTKFPDENELSRIIGFSCITVRRAMKELEQAGMIQRVRGHGSFLRQTINKSPRLETLLFIQTFATTGVNERLLFPLHKLCQSVAYDFRFIHAEEPDSAVSEEIANSAGVFLTGRVTQEWLNLIAGLGKPCVLIGNPEPDDSKGVMVLYDWRAMAKGVTSRLLASGCDRVAILVPPASYRPSSEIMQGYKDALDEAGITFEKNLVAVSARGQNGVASMKLLGENLKRKKRNFNALVCNCDAYPYLASAFLGTGINVSGLVFGVMDDSWELHKHEIPLVNNIVTGYFPEGLAETAMKAMRYSLNELMAEPKDFLIAPKFKVTLNRFRKEI